jgi:hypothetical protein
MQGNDSEMKKLFTATKLTPDEEIRKLERELMPLRARERQLLDEISTARSQLAREQGATPMVIMDGNRGLDPKRKAAAERQRDRVSAADANLARAEKKLLEMAPVLTASVNRLQELRREAETNRVERCGALVSAAVESAASSRDEFRSQEAKLSDLRRQLAQVDAELHHAMTSQPTVTDAESRAAVLIATGEMPSQAAAPAMDARVKEMLSRQATLRAAVRLQERSIEQARRLFASEVAKHLRPAAANTVQRIAEGYEIARTATADAERIRHAFSQATGSDGMLPCFVFRGVPVPTFEKDEFAFWIEEMREQGYEV